jgi:XTP/dITP diphosphohydrolase
VTRLLVATTNPGKLAELRPLLAEHGFQIVGLRDLQGVPIAREDGRTCAENARAKATHYAKATGLPALADDSGLEVAALGGAPGVHSARWAGPRASDADNRCKLLAELAGRADRAARFVCALCLAEPGAGGRMGLVEVEGHCAGTVLEAERGAGGFGYDALFVPDDPAAAGKSFAELSRAEKERFSHRGVALRRLAGRLTVRAAMRGGAPPKGPR